MHISDNAHRWVVVVVLRNIRNSSLNLDWILSRKDERKPTCGGCSSKFTSFCRKGPLASSSLSRGSVISTSNSQRAPPPPPLPPRGKVRIASLNSAWVRNSADGIRFPRLKQVFRPSGAFSWGLGRKKSAAFSRNRWKKFPSQRGALNRSCVPVRFVRRSVFTRSSRSLKTFANRCLTRLLGVEISQFQFRF